VTFDISMQGISIGFLEIRFYSLMILSGIGVGVVIAQIEAKRYGEDPTHVMNITVIGAILSIVGARAYHVLDRDQWPYYAANPGDIVKVWNGGIGIFGAIAGAAIGLLIYVWWVNRSARLSGGRRAQRLSMLRWLDIGAPAFLVGQAVGRWGNFFNEELFGPPTDLPWGIPISQVNRPIEYIADTHFHPLFLYESLLSLLGLIVLLYLARRLASWLVVGDILLFYFMWYSAERFALEFLRTDNWKFGALPTAQIIGVLLTTAAIGVMVWRHRQARADHSTDHSDSDSGQRKQSRTAQRRQRRRTGPPAGS
jgi:phosphatidylglycerol:prolipoprotein diacylglycerol transferase